jgi:hypothetical protein
MFEEWHEDHSSQWIQRRYARVSSLYRTSIESSYYNEDYNGENSESENSSLD